MIANPVSDAQTTVSGTAIATIVSEFSSCRPSGTRSNARVNAASDGASGISSSPTGGGAPGACSAPSTITASGTESSATTAAAPADRGQAPASRALWPRFITGSSWTA